MKYLVTGGCGFLGSNISKMIIENGDDLIVFDNLSRFGSYQNLEWLKTYGEFEFIHGDIRNANDVDHLLECFKPDYIYHLAGQVAMTTSILDPRMDFEVNALGSFNLLNAVRLYSPNSAVIYSSTNKVYGGLEQFDYIENDKRYECIDYPDGFDESVNLEFHSPYGSSKGSADQYMQDFARIYGVRTVVFRHSSMYGGRQYSTSDQGWVGWFVKKALDIRDGNATERFTISGNGKQVRDLLFADDCVKLYLKASENIDCIAGRAFNIGGGLANSSSILELFDTLNSKLSITMDYEKLPPRASDQKVFIADTSAISSLIDWAPLVEKDEGIERMIAWVDKSD